MKLRAAKKATKAGRWPRERDWSRAQHGLARYYHDRPELLRRKIEVPKEVHHWGTEHVVTPAMIAEPMGDGLQLIWLSPLNTRPWYYVARIDSRWSLDHYGADPFIDHVDDLYDIIEEQFGRIDFECEVCGEAEMSFSECECQQVRWFPLLSDDGSVWGKHDWPA